MNMFQCELTEKWRKINYTVGQFLSNGKSRSDNVRVEQQVVGLEYSLLHATTQVRERLSTNQSLLKLLPKTVLQQF